MEKELIYTGVNKSFRYTDGDCVSTGSMLVDNGVFTRVENGNVSENGIFLGAYNYAVENGEMKNLWMNMADPSEAATFTAQINGCFEALIGDNE